MRCYELRARRRNVTEAKRWPDIACQQRNVAAEEAIVGIRALRPLVRGEQFDRTETLRRQSIALAALLTIVGLLQEAGAPIRISDL